MNDLVVKFIYLLICGWFIFLTVYVVGNQFAHESMSVFWPAFGAIFISCALVFKAIQIDAPVPREVSIPIVILQHLPSGSLLSPFRYFPGEQRPSYIIRSQGLSEVEHIQHFNAFKQLNLTALLMNSKFSQPDGPLIPLVGEILEYILLDWLASNHVPSWLNDEKINWGISGGGGGSTPKTQPDMVKLVTIGGADLPTNRLVEAKPIQINLPSGAIVNASGTPANRVIKIETNYSVSEIRIQYTGGGKFSPNLDWLTQYVAGHWNIQSPDTTLTHNFRVEWKLSIQPFFRYAREAKLHTEWFEKISARMEESFSWAEIRKRLEKRRNFLGPDRMYKANN